MLDFTKNVYLIYKNTIDEDKVKIFNILHQDITISLYYIMKHFRGKTLSKDIFENLKTFNTSSDISTVDVLKSINESLNKIIRFPCSIYKSALNLSDNTSARRVKQYYKSIHSEFKYITKIMNEFPPEDFLLELLSITSQS